MFLVAARPARGAPDCLPHDAAVIIAVLVGVALVTAASSTRRRSAGALTCGVTGGLAAGIAAVLISAALKESSQRGLLNTLAGLELWGALVMAVCAQIGAPLSTPTLAVP